MKYTACPRALDRKEETDVMAMFTCTTIFPKITEAFS